MYGCRLLVNKFAWLFVGADSTRNDGVYTGILSANQLYGDGYYSIRVSFLFLLLGKKNTTCSVQAKVEYIIMMSVDG